MDTEKQIDFKSLAKQIADHVKSLHHSFEPNQWNRLAGQWLVYGLERSIGFSRAVELEALVERAWVKGQDIEPVIHNWLKGLLP